ncbi:MAG: CoA transferase subunit A [Actinomycetes bacterium]
MQTTPPQGDPAAALRPADKVYESAVAAVADVGDGASLAVGGFGLCGVPTQLIAALHDAGTTDLRVVSNNCGVDEWGLGILLAHHRIGRVIASYVGENKEFARQFLSGELEVELTPQGTLAERLRAGGAGIPAFYTVTGVGTQVAEGGLPWRYHPDGSVALSSPAKETRDFEVAGQTRTYVLEESIVTDFALVHAWKGDRSGNLVFRESARNFNPLCAAAGRVTVAQVENLVEVGEIPPEDVDTPGVFVQRVVDVGPDVEKRIERRTVRPRPEGEAR